MKNIKKETTCRVSDRAYRIIISDVIDSMTGCKIDPFTFKQVVTAVRHYLKPEGKPTGLGRKAKVIFERLLPDLDRAIRRSETARAAGRRRREAAKKAALAAEAVGTEAVESAVQPQLPAATPQRAPKTAGRPSPETIPEPIKTSPEKLHERSLPGGIEFGYTPISSCRV